MTQDSSIERVAASRLPASQRTERNEKLTSIASPPKPKLPPVIGPKVFCIGLSRTGTSSLAVALARLGLRCIHYPQSNSHIESAPAVADTPVVACWKWLDAVYADSKFILTVREKEVWLASCEAMWRIHLQVQDRFMKKVHRMVYGTVQYDRDLFSAAWDRHLAEVQVWFRKRPGDLLVMNICAGEGWEKLCPFLGYEIPSEPFPRRHTRDKIGQDSVFECRPWGTKVNRKVWP